MKKIFPRIMLGLFFLTTLFSCNENKMSLESATIYFPLAARANTNGIYQATFDYANDTTFLISVYCASNIKTPRNIDIEVDLATEDWRKNAEGNAAFASYELLPESAYTVQPGDMNLTIRKGTDRADLKVHFQMTALQAGKKYMLPLSISSISDYELSEDYNILFFGIEPK